MPRTVLVVLLAALAAVLAGLAATHLPTGPEPPPATAQPAPEPARAAAPPAPAEAAPGESVAEPDGPEVDHRRPVPMHVKSVHPPNTRIPITEQPQASDGIRFPDGTVLPLLNGMTWAPLAYRSSRSGPVPPVVAKWVDFEGFEWWVHADGSSTTTKYHEVRLQDGTVYWDPMTFHTEKLPPEDDVGISPMSPPAVGGDR